MIEVEFSHANVLFTGRRGGVSDGPYSTLNLGILTDDEPESVERNREIVRAKAGVRELRWNIQAHGTRITDTGDHIKPVEADGISTSEPGVGAMVLVADCLPVALSDTGRVTMVHCGWRGLAGEILGQAASVFEDGFDAAIGPGICQRHFEVSQDVLDRFARWPQAASGRHLDLKKVAHDQLKSFGAREVMDVGRCTYCEPEEFFSHRRDGGVTGRQAGIAQLKGLSRRPLDD